jgi:integrase
MSALNTAVRRKHIPQNPAEHVELPSGRRPKAVVWTDDRVEHWRRTGERPAVAVWTPQQTGTFLDAAMADRLYPLYHLIAYRGLRRGEAIGIQWPDVDLDAGYLRITQQVILIGWETEVGKPKTDGGERTVSLDTGSVQVLRRWRERQNAERAATHGAWQHTGLVFAREDGNQLHPEHVADTFQRIYQEAGLPPIRLHDLRHTAASLALQAGVPMKVVSEQLGHSSLGITADTYTSVLPAVAQAAAEAVAGIVPRRAPEPEQADPDQTPADGRDAAAFTDRSHPASQEGPRG